MFYLFFTWVWDSAEFETNITMTLKISQENKHDTEMWEASCVQKTLAKKKVFSSHHDPTLGLGRLQKVKGKYYLQWNLHINQSMSVINVIQYCMLKGMQGKADLENRQRLWIAPSEIAAWLEAKLAQESGSCFVKVMQDLSILPQHTAGVGEHRESSSPQRQCVWGCSQ